MSYFNWVLPDEKNSLRLLDRWEPQGICGSKGVMTSLFMSLDRGIKAVKATLSPTGFLLASAYCQYDNSC